MDEMKEFFGLIARPASVFVAISLVDARYGETAYLSQLIRRMCLNLPISPQVKKTPQVSVKTFMGMRFFFVVFPFFITIF